VQCGLHFFFGDDNTPISRISFSLPTSSLLADTCIFAVRKRGGGLGVPTVSLHDLLHVLTTESDPGTAFSIRVGKAVKCLVTNISNFNSHFGDHRSSVRLRNLVSMVFCYVVEGSTRSRTACLWNPQFCL